MIGNQVKKIRKQKGFSQEMLADAIKVTQSGLSARESGAQNFSAEELQNIAKALGVKVDVFYQSENEYYTNLLNETIREKASQKPELSNISISSETKRVAPISAMEYFELTMSTTAINASLFGLYEDIQKLIDKAKSDEKETKETLIEKMNTLVLKVNESLDD